MMYNEIPSLVADLIEDSIYISDIETYDLYYINKSLREKLGLVSDEEWKNRKCYEVLQGNQSPCDFCTNHLIKTGEIYTWKIYNKLINGWYNLRDTKINLMGKDVRMEIATEVTELVKVELQLRESLDEEQAIITCIETLCTGKAPAESIHDLLKMLGARYNSDRAFIFELKEANTLVDNTYEWCSIGIEPQLDNLQNVTYEVLSPWFEEFKKNSNILINDLDVDLDHDSQIYKALKPQGIKSLIATPMVQFNGSIIGFIGVDNPKVAEGSSTLIDSVAKFAMDYLLKINLINELEHLSYRDSLTGLRNRLNYQRKILSLTNVIGNSVNRNIGVANFDVNGLKIANMQKGHNYGDYLLVTLAKILEDIFGDNVYRAGGDEFIVLEIEVSQEAFDEKMNSVLNLMKQNKELNIAVGHRWIAETDDVEKFVESVDGLMYVDKQKYYELESGNSKYKNILAENVINEINNGLYYVYLQPKVDLDTMDLVGAEALIRKFENGVMVSPITFIPFYEKEGIINFLDIFVFEQICILYNKWSNKISTFKNFTFSINLSRITMAKEDLLENLVSICKKFDVPLSVIRLEVTETIDVKDSQYLTEVIEKFQNAGFTVSLDDFGIGQSNLSILSEANFSEIKIDKSLVDNLTIDKKSFVLAKHVVSICNDLGIDYTVAEGIETQEQLERLREIHCKVGQGYLFDKPMPIKDFEDKFLR